MSLIFSIRSDSRESRSSDPATAPNRLSDLAPSAIHVSPPAGFKKKERFDMTLLLTGLPFSFIRDLIFIGFDLLQEPCQQPSASGFLSLPNDSFMTTAYRRLARWYADCNISGSTRSGRALCK
jgi:hypothetical protein